ncbi:MAG: DUF1501 domain-containing protein [Gemmatimonas sp.]|uniref:DUF1501 domain-containing protein n=1 Tax=Gemmatimonas sp. TaxID=1962908 RepID=UPI00391F742D
MSAMAAAMPAWFPEVRLASSQNSARDIVVSVFMRGGADGLTLVAPFGDPLYYAGRPTIAVPRPDATSPNRGTALDDFFMLPPGMAALLPAYRAGQLAIVHAAGQRYTTSRSHFEAEIYLENGKPDYAIETGWLARHLASSEPLDPSAPLRAISVTGGTRRTMQGAPRTLPIPNPDSYQLGSPNELALQRLFANAWSPMRNAALDGLNTVNVMRGVDFPGYRPANGAQYGDNYFARSLRSVATMIRAEIGLEAAHLDYGGWDTHANQGSVGRGNVMHDLMTEFSGALAAFWQDIMQGPPSLRVTLVVATEFGRNVRENGSMGTDHGRAGVMFVMGPAVRGGRVFGDWPGIAMELLEDGQDLRVTTDTRDILAELVQTRLGNANQSLVFPNYVPRFRGVFR